MTEPANPQELHDAIARVVGFFTRMGVAEPEEAAKRMCKIPKKMSLLQFMYCYAESRGYQMKIFEGFSCREEAK